MTDVSFIEFTPDDVAEVVSVMAELADRSGSGWLTLDPEFDERFPPPTQTLWGRLLTGRGPYVPRATWVPADTERRTPEPVSIGILHATGPKAVERLAEADIDVPDRWRVIADHPKRGLVAYVPIDIAHDDVLAWTCRAARALTKIPLTGQWRAAVHRP